MLVQSKGNLGHCETAAGVAGFIKAILMLLKAAIPPLTNHTSLNSLGGTADAISATKRLLQAEPMYRSVKAQRLDVTHAYLTKLTDRILPDLRAVVAELNFKAPTIPLATCTRDHDHAITPDCIISHLRDPIDFQAAVRRLEHRLGGCIWLEAGCDLSAFTGVKRATALPERHLFQAVQFNGSKTPMDVIANTITGLWREGIDVSFWGFLDPTLAPQQVWLLPYHFEEARQWLPHIDHAMEQLQGRGIPFDRTPQTPQTDVPKLVTRQKLQPNSDVEHFNITTCTRGYIDIVTGHSVLLRPLCPAGMYMECVAMAAQLLLDEPKTHSGLALDNRTFECPLGVDPDRAVTINLASHLSKTGWSFEISSRPRRQEIAKSTLHATGNISYRNDIHLHPYQRYISRRVHGMNNSADLESLRKDKAYMIFTRVIDYSEIFWGISLIKFADTDPGAHQCSLWGTIIRDDCIEVLRCHLAGRFRSSVWGLLINSHSICPADSAYLTVGADSIRTAEFCDLEKCKEWTVYAVLEEVEHSKARGDVFVMHPSGEVALVMSGVRSLTKTLETILTAPDKAPRHRNNSEK